MQVIDAFRFPTDNACEQALFQYQPQASTGTIEPEVVHNCYALFDHQAVSEVLISEAKGSEAFIKGRGSQSWFCLLPLDREQGYTTLELLSSCEFTGIVLHPYLQQITRDHYDLVLGLCQEASRQGLIIVICTAFGSRHLYSINPLPLVHYLAEHIDTPLVLAHAGGAKVLEAMLLAEVYPQLWLDTSFSLSYWKGSSVDLDFAFAIKKIGYQRWLFGSDAPFVSQRQAIDDHQVFLRQLKLPDSAVEAVMSGNARRLLAR